MDNEETNQTTETEETGVQNQSSTESAETETNENEQTIDSDKVVEKLQKRLGKEQADKNNAIDQLNDLKQKLADYESGKVSVKKLSDEEKKEATEKARDTELQNLRDKVKLTETTSQADEVLREAGFVATKEELQMIASTDDEATFKNVKTLTDLVNRVREETRTEFTRGITPKATGQNTGKEVTQEEFEAMSIVDQVKLHADNPELFKKLTGGI